MEVCIHSALPLDVETQLTSPSLSLLVIESSRILHLYLGDADYLSDPAQEHRRLRGEKHGTTPDS